MKTKILLIGALMLVLVSCNKKDDPANSEGDINLNNPTYADKTVAETKTDLENTGIKMVTELKAMNQDKGVKATVNLVDLAANSGSVSKKLKTSTYFKVLGAVKTLSGNKPDVKVMFEALEDSDKISILDEFDGIAGVYTYNYINEEFDFEEDVASGKVVFEFPASIASRDAQNNDGKLTIYKPKVKTGNFTALGTSITELPTELKYELNVGSTVVSTFLFTASYQEDGVPTSVESTITLGAFAFKVTYGYKETEVTANWSFTHGETTIFDIGGTAGGNFKKDDLDNLEEETLVVDTFYYCINYNWETGECLDSSMYIDRYTKTEIYPERVLENANAHVQLMDIKIAGQIDFTNFMKDIRSAEEGDYPIDSATVMINRNIDLVVVYASDNTAIAKAEAYLKNEQNEVYECNFDQNNEWVCETFVKTDKVVDVQMVFADGSKSTMEAYFEEGFDNVIDSFNEFITELNNTYDWDMEPIENE